MDDTVDHKPEHSPLGASSMSRWKNCVGSHRLIQQLAPSEFPEEEPDYTKEGTAAHAVIERCLREGAEAWEFIGQHIEGVKVTIPMTTAVQVYLDEVLPLQRGADNCYIEFPISAPIHPLFYGKLDFAAVKDGTLYIRDYKNGEGVYVDERGPQTKYYAYGVLHLHPEVRRVNIGIVQPNYNAKPVRSYEVDADDIHAWAMEELLPAMQAAERGGDLTPGEHCRFCPAKLVCPMLTGLFAAAATSVSPQVLSAMSDFQLAMDAKLIKAVKMRASAIEKELFTRLNHGREIDGFKLVHKRTNRVWKEGADALFFELYGADALNPAMMKSPAQLEELGPETKQLVRQWSYTPESGLTVAEDKDARIGVKPDNSQKAFANLVDGLLKAEDI